MSETTEKKVAVEIAKVLQRNGVALIGTVKIRESSSASIERKDVLEIAGGKHTVRDTTGPFFIFDC